MNLTRLWAPLLALASVAALQSASAALQIGGQAEAGLATNAQGISATSSLSTAASYQRITASSVLNSTLSAQQALSSDAGFTPFRWASSNSLVSKTFITSVSVTANYTHAESLSLSETQRQLTDSASVGLISDLKRTATTSHQLTSTLSATQAKNISDDNTVRFGLWSLTNGYNWQHRLSPRLALGANVQHTLLENSQLASATVNATATRGQLTWVNSIGGTYSVADQTESAQLSLNTQLSYQVNPTNQLSIAYQQQRSDASTALQLIEQPVALDLTELVDVESYTGTWQGATRSGVLTYSLSYERGQITNVNGFAGVVVLNRTDFDNGTFNIGLKINPQTQFSFTQRFSLLEDNNGVNGELTYNRDLSPALYFKSGVTFNSQTENTVGAFVKAGYRFGVQL